MDQIRPSLLSAAALLCCVLGAHSNSALAQMNAVARRSIAELKPAAAIRVGKTADWVAITADAVWVGSTGPNAVHRINSATNQLVATVALPGEPCAGLATGYGSLWVPLCGKAPLLAKVDLVGNRLTAVFNIGPADAEAGITTGADSVWLVVDRSGSLARIDPENGKTLQTVRVPAGSYNPMFSDGVVWVTHVDGSDVTSIDAATGALLATTSTGPSPRFLTVGGGAIWTLNQGDGSLTRIDAQTRKATQTIALGTPGHGGDIAFGDGTVWTTVVHVPLSAIDQATDTLRCQWIGPGGDSLGVGHDALWLTDYHAGTISRIPLKSVQAHCRFPRGP
jgi:virginiamycin B lyase